MFDIFKLFGESLIDLIAVTLELSMVGDGVGFRIVAENIEQAFQTTPGLPVVVNGVCRRCAVNPEIALGGATFAGGEVVDGGFIDLQNFGVEKLVADGSDHGGK